MTKPKNRWVLTERGGFLFPRSRNKVWELMFHQLDNLCCKARVIGTREWKLVAKEFFLRAI